ncbi:MAG TPA: hypothetical protein VF530_06735 [Planctomycetota bacterium]
MRGLSLLAARRTLPPWLLLGLGLWLLLAARASGGEPLLAGEPEALAALRALARQDVWSGLFVAAPLLLHQAARLGRPEAGAWLMPSPSAPLARAAALAAGCALACALAAALTACAAELAVPETAPAWRRARMAASPTAVLTDSEPSVLWSIAVTERDASLRLWTTVAIGSGPAVTARLRTAASGDERSLTRRIAGRTPLLLPVPPGTHTLELERVGDGALLVLPPDALEVLAPVASERSAAPRLFAHAFLALATGCALAFGLARRLRPALASTLVLALALLVARAPLPLPAWPAAWSELGRGLVPDGPGAAAAATSALLAGLGLLLQARGGGRA